MYKNKEEIEKIVDSKKWDDAWSEEVNKDIKNFIHQIRQDDLEEVKKIIKEKGLHLGYKNDILETLNKLNK